MKLISKISMRDVVGGKSVILETIMKDKTISHPVARVIGIASGLKTGEGDNGPWTGLTGQFKATNLLTGEVYQSGKCFMPDVAQDMIVGALMAGNTASVSFGFDVSVEYDEKSATSYVYTAASLMDSGPTDPISMLEQSILVPALENKGESGSNNAGAEKSGKKK